MLTSASYAGVMFGVLLAAFVSAAADDAFPGVEWEQREPGALGLDGAELDEVAARLGGRGCVIKDGYIVKSWGDLAQSGDWLSSAKPVLSTILFFAIEEDLVKSVDQPIAEFGWDFRPKDKGITFRHLGAMSSGYARPEGPGEAWAYNDFAIQLYQRTLFDKVFKGDAKEIAEAPERLGALGLQDGLRFNGKRRIYASVRDFARIVWFWLNRGNWNGRQVLPSRYFNEYMRPQTPKDLPQTAKAETDDYLGIGSYGGGSDHFSVAGPGIYGFNWWFNDTGRLHPHALTWPDAPPDTIMSLGAGGNSSAFIPSLNVALVCAQGDWGNVRGGERDAEMNRVLGLLAEACGYTPEPVLITGERRQWRPITLSFRGDDLAETGEPNPFTDYRLNVAFSKGGRTLVVPGFYAADGNALESGGEAGPVWRVHFAPDEEGVWEYRVSCRTGPGIATASERDAGQPTAFDGLSGRIEIGPADPAAPGFIATATLRHTGGRYLQFAGTKEYFIKGGVDSPENVLAFADFDGTVPTHKYEPHAGDWRFGDPVWHGDKGKNLIGALNYLAGKGINSVYSLTMNVGGDGKDTWPWISDTEHLRFDCSKLDQWDVVFRHMDRLGLMLHVVTQEQENDQLLDGGELGPERRLYYRELIARFAHHPALVWNLGEENTNTPEQRRAFAAYIRALDPYDHPIVIHTFPSQRDEVYTDLLGFADLDGPSLQLADMRETHRETLKWVQRSREAGRPWCVCLDEIGPPSVGVKSDAEDPDHDDVRRYALWGNLMAGGGGCEWFFQSDNHCEDWRARDRMWDLTRYARAFFQQYLPFHEMVPADELVSGEGAWCLAKPGEVYAVYTPNAAELRLEVPEGTYDVAWYDPRHGGALAQGKPITGPGRIALGPPPSDPDKDWAVLIRRAARH